MTDIRPPQTCCITPPQHTHEAPKAKWDITQTPCFPSYHLVLCDLLSLPFTTTYPSVFILSFRPRLPGYFTLTSYYKCNTISDLSASVSSFLCGNFVLYLLSKYNIQCLIFSFSLALFILLFIVSSFSKWFKFLYFFQQPLSSTDALGLNTVYSWQKWRPYKKRAGGTSVERYVAYGGCNCECISA